MLAANNEYIKEASDTIYQLSQEETICLQCEAREDYYRRQRSVQNQLREAEERATIAETENVKLKAEIARLKALLEK